MNSKQTLGLVPVFFILTYCVSIFTCNAVSVTSSSQESVDDFSMDSSSGVLSAKRSHRLLQLIISLRNSEWNQSVLLPAIVQYILTRILLITTHSVLDFFPG